MISDKATLYHTTALLLKVDREAHNPKILVKM